MVEPGLWDMLLELRSRGISSTRVLEAMEQTPRSRFVDEAQRNEAYGAGLLPLPCGQVMLPPLLVAQMLQLAGLTRDTKVLVIGLGSGWLAGVAARIAPRTFAVERYQQIIQVAEASLARCGLSVTTRWGDGHRGWPSQAPFDRILVTGSLGKWPKALTDQLAPGGVSVGFLGGSLVRNGEAVLAAVVPPLEVGRSESL